MKLCSLKKTVFFLFLVLLVWTFQAHAWVLNEDFSGGLPSGWLATDAVGSSLSWSGLAVCGEGNYTGGSGDAMCASSDDFGPFAYDTMLITTSITPAGGWNVFTLEYDANYQDFGSGDKLDLLHSTDGVTWPTTLSSWTTSHGSYFSTPGEAQSVDLSTYAGTTFYLAWRYYNTAAGAWDWYAQVDNVKILESFLDEMDTADNWNVDGLWRRDDSSACLAPDPGYSSATGAFMYNKDEASCNYRTGGGTSTQNSGNLTLKGGSAITIPTNAEAVKLTFMSHERTECSEWAVWNLDTPCDVDIRKVQVNDGSPGWTTIWSSENGSTEGMWYQRSLSLTPFIGDTVRVRYRFNTVDEFYNGDARTGWYVDDVAIDLCYDTFTDVPGGYWAEDFINSIYCHDITTGYGDGTYGPEDPVTRAQMAVFLVRAIEGDPSSSYCFTNGTPFLDVDTGYWACPWITRAHELGVTTGFPDNTYRPDVNVTREQMAAFVYRSRWGEPIPDCADPTSYSDTYSTTWSCEYIEGLTDAGIVGGYGDGTFRPFNDVKRSEMAAFLGRGFLGM